MTNHLMPAPERGLKNLHGDVTGDVWARGDYSTVATELLAPLGPVLVAASGVGTGDRVLDVAAGAGNTSIPAALNGADVIASDLCPELLEKGKTRAAARDASLSWQKANAEALPFDDDEFDIVLSSVGVMFAPDHQRAADELVRVCRPGGTIGVISWTPEGFFGRMLATLQPRLPVSEEGVGTAPTWGREDYVRALLGNRVGEFSAQRRTLRVEGFTDGATLRDYFKLHYGLTISAYENIESEPARIAALDSELAELGNRYIAWSLPMEWEYLLVTASKLGPQ